MDAITHISHLYVHLRTEAVSVAPKSLRGNLPLAHAWYTPSELELPKVP